MPRLILILCALILISGCDKPAAQEVQQQAHGKRELTANAKPAQVIEDFIAGSWKGAGYDIISSKEVATTFRKAPAVAVYVQWKMKGEEEPRHDLLLIQDGRVKSCTAFDVNRSVEDNAITVVKDLETP
jgi:hypothetical protein